MLTLLLPIKWTCLEGDRAGHVTRHESLVGLYEN